MKKFRSMLSAFIVAVLSAAFILPLAACDPDQINPGQDGANAVHVTSVGGKDIANVTVEIYDGDKLLGSGVTNESGRTSFDLPNGTYTVKFSSLPAGYYVEKEYTIKSSDELTTLAIPSKVIESGSSPRKYLTGDVIYDFSMTAYTYNADKPEKFDTQELKLSEIFKDKTAVVLNFWYQGCTWCAREYPAMKAAYELYSDKVEIIAINDYGQSDEVVKEQTVEDETPYLMCRDAAGVGALFEKSGWPFSVMIDRYGVICEMTSTQIEQSFWEQWFAKFTADDYSQDYVDGGDGDLIFVPDKPEDFNVRMSETQLISRAINKTDKAMLFSEDITTNTDGGKASWPWDLTDDKTAIYPTNKGHRGTNAIIYLEVELEENEVLAFDYKLNTVTDQDYLYVAADARDGIGKQVMMVSGQQDWTTGYAYVALEKGTHEIAFLYARTSVNGATDENVLIKNIRITSISEMNADLVAKETSLEIAYPAVRQYYDDDVSLYNEFENVYLAKDGYYHAGTKNDGEESENDPYLMADITHSTPFFANASTTLNSVFTDMKNKGGFTFNSVDYTTQFESYVTYSSNSKHHGLVPVTKELQEILDAYYKSEISPSSQFYVENGWMLFCVTYRNYGIPVNLEDPIKGLAYFSAYDAHETTGITDESKLNKVTFDTIIMPKGLIYTFTPKQSAVYHIHSTDTEIVKGYLEDIDGHLYGPDLNVASHLATPLVSSTDRFYRYGGENNFNIYYYLEAGTTYYITVYFSTVEVMGSFNFRIDNIGQYYEYLHTATSEVYVAPEGENQSLILPVFADVEFNGTYYIDKRSQEPVYCDFTELNFFFDSFTVEYILNAGTSFFDLSKIPNNDGNLVDFNVNIAGEDLTGRDFTEDMKKYFKAATPDNATLTGTLDGKAIELSLTKNFVTVTYDGKTGFAAVSSDDMYSEKGQTVSVKLGNDVTDAEGNVTEKAPTVSLTLKLENGMLSVTSDDKNIGQTTYTHRENDMLYGLVPVDRNLYEILQLANYKYRGYENDNEWLRACWYMIKVGTEA